MEESLGEGCQWGPVALGGAIVQCVSQSSTYSSQPLARSLEQCLVYVFRMDNFEIFMCKSKSKGAGVI